MSKTITPKTAAELLADGTLTQENIDAAKSSVDKLSTLDVLDVLATLEHMGVPVKTPEEADNDPRVALKDAVDTAPAEVGMATFAMLLSKIADAF
jgi:hypothetical protein